MKKSLLVLLFIFLNFKMFPLINQGDVLINSFDPYIDGDYAKEMVVLVNYTSTPIDLNGYEIKCYKFNAIAQLPFWQFNGTYILPPHRFLLITNNIASVSGISADIQRTDSPGSGFIDHDGYLTIRKIGANNPSEYIDIVKYSRYAYPPPDPRYAFTDFPPNSGIDLSMPGVADDTGPNPKRSYLTRGGVSGDISSLTYTGYGMVGQTVSDFFEVQSETDTTYIQNSMFPALPVELSSFSAVILSKKEILLKWRTETEVSNYGFEIQRKTFSDNEWTRIGFVAGNGNSNSPKDYSFTDGNPVNGSRFNYRLKQIDTDGKYEFSDMIEVEIVPGDFILFQNYPNPFNPSTKITYQLPRESKVILKIYDIMGAEVTSLVNENKESGVYEVEFNGNSLANGTYIYRIVAGDFIETKKMVLIK